MTRSLISVLTDATCSFSCWYAEQEICRCSCGGKNHGALLDPKNPVPERIVKINGGRFRLEAVGEFTEIRALFVKFVRRLGWAKITQEIRDTKNLAYHQPYYGHTVKGPNTPVVMQKAMDRHYSWPELKLMGNKELHLLWVNLIQPEPLWCPNVIECERCLLTQVNDWVEGVPFRKYEVEDDPWW